MKPRNLLLLPLVAIVAGIGATEPSVAASPPSSYAHGLDVSAYEGAINWSRVAGAGISFAIARVSDGTTHPDAYFQRNWSGMKAAGVVRGVYQFFRPAEDAVAQADLLINKVSFEPGDLPPFCDVEVSGGVSASRLGSQIALWCNEIKAKTGLTPLIYTTRGFWSTDMGMTRTFPGVGLWIANWGVSSPRLPSSGWSDWVFWQWSDKASVPGVSTADSDVFHGTVADLKAYAASHGTVMPGGSSSSGSSSGGSGSTGSSSSGSSHPVLRQGDTGPDVVTLQQSLVRDGYNPGTIDGAFGPKTLAAVEAFQQAHGLVVDGIVGPLTWGAL